MKSNVLYQKNRKVNYMYRQGVVYQRKGYYTPQVVLAGKYLEAAGFNIGDPITVTVTDGKVTIVREECAA